MFSNNDFHGFFVSFFSPLPFSRGLTFNNRYLNLIILYFLPVSAFPLHRFCPFFISLYSLFPFSFCPQHYFYFSQHKINIFKIFTLINLPGKQVHSLAKNIVKIPIGNLRIKIESSKKKLCERKRKGRKRKKKWEMRND